MPIWHLLTPSSTYIFVCRVEGLGSRIEYWSHDVEHVLGMISAGFLCLD